MSPSRYHQNLNLATVKRVLTFAHKALNDGQGPERINILEGKVLQHLTVPHVTLVYEFLTLIVAVIARARRILKSDRGKTLLIASEVRVVTKVEALLLEQLLDSVHILDDFLVHVRILMKVFVEGHEIDALDQVNSIARRHGRHLVLLGYDHNKNLVADVDDA